MVTSSASTTGEANAVAARAATMMVSRGVGGARKAPRVAVVVGLRIVAVAVSSVPVHTALGQPTKRETLALTLVKWREDGEWS